MLKNIPVGISPQLMFNLMRMGHGDEIVIADGNFPAESCGQNVVRADGQSGPQVLSNILKLLPLDSYEACVFLMDPMDCDKTRYPGGTPPIWAEYNAIIDREEEVPKERIVKLERFEFYKRAKTSFCIVATSEQAQYANIILKKGVIKEKL